MKAGTVQSCALKHSISVVSHINHSIEVFYSQGTLIKSQKNRDVRLAIMAYYFKTTVIRFVNLARLNIAFMTSAITMFYYQHVLAIN